MKFILSRYNHDMTWMQDYDGEYFIYDRSEVPMPGANKVPNVGSDIYDKFTYIIDHYDDLPEVAIYSKANLFKYITKEEFDQIKDNTTFTPIFSKKHEEKMIYEMELGRQKLLQDFREKNTELPLQELYLRLNKLERDKVAPVRKFSFYDEEGMYNELNVPGYINHHPVKSIWLVEEIEELLGIKGQEYVKFAPGSNYILPKTNILKHPKELYEKLRSYLEWDVYPGEAMVIERGLYQLWK